MSERIAVYRRYRLAATAGGIGTAFQREDGTHTYLDLREVLGEYPRSRALYERAAVRENVLADLIIGGLVVAGAGGVDQLTGSPSNQAARNAVYGLGGAMLLMGLIGVLAWHDPLDEIPATYNEELRADLRLSPAAISASP